MGDFLTKSPILYISHSIRKWCRFCESVAVETPLSESGIQLYVSNGAIVLQQVVKGSEVEVYSTIGTLVAKQMALSESVVIPLPVSGVYIVRVGEKCWKVIV